MFCAVVWNSSAICASVSHQPDRIYPSRARDEANIIAALRAHLGDTSEFVDPFYRRTFRTQDFVLGALVRLLGPERFYTPDAAWKTRSATRFRGGPTTCAPICWHRSRDLKGPS
jgi:hypothetical protein